MRKTAFALLVAIVLSASMAAVASADGAKARFDASGSVVFVGPAPGGLVTDTKFRLRRDGSVKRIVVKTAHPPGSNEGEMVVGTPLAVGDCQDRGSGGCATITGLLATAPVLSVHGSTARLKVAAQTTTTLADLPGYGALLVSLGAPAPLLATIPVDQLEGEFAAGSKLRGDFSLAAADGALIGGSKLRIRGAGKYACFSVVLPGPLAALGPMPGPLAPCLAGAPGAQMGATYLAVTDTGRIKADVVVGSFAAAGLDSLKARVTVSVTGIPGIPGASGGTVQVTRGVAKFSEGDEGDD